MTPLRCRLNDLAFVRPGLPTCEFMRGKVVTIVSGPVADVARQGPGWLVEGHGGLKPSRQNRRPEADQDPRPAR